MKASYAEKIRVDVGSWESGPEAISLWLEVVDTSMHGNHYTCKHMNIFSVMLYEMI